MIRLIFYLGHYSFLIAVVLFSYAVGARLTRRVSFDSAWEKFSFSTGVGLGTIASAVFLLGLLGSLYSAVVLAIAAMTTILLWDVWKQLGEAAVRAWRSLTWDRGLAYAVVLIVVAALALLPLYPPVHWDATADHLSAAKIFARSHAVRSTPYLRLPVTLQLNEMLFTLALLVADDLSAQLVQFLMMMVVAAALYAWGRRLFQPRAGLWGAALWLSNPLVLWLGASGYIDDGLAMFLTLAVYAFGNWFLSRSRPWLAVSAALFGFSAAEKYLAWFPIVVVGLFLLGVAAKERRLRDVVLFSAVLVAIAAPWYVRIAYYTGNPIWPYWGSRLGYGPWTAAEANALVTDQLWRGGGRKLGALLRLPWSLTFHDTTTFRGEYPLSPAYLLLLPLCLLAAVRNSYLRALLAATGLYTLFWFATAQQTRYLVPALPLLSLAAGAALDEVVVRSGRTHGAALAALICLLLVAPGALRILVAGRVGSPLMPAHFPPVTAKARDAFIEDVNPLYRAVAFLNRTRGAHYTLYTLEFGNMAYYADGQFVGDRFGPASYRLIVPHLFQPLDLYPALRKFGADYFLVAADHGADRDSVVEKLLAPDFLNSRLKLVYAGSGSLLFELEERPVEVAREPELLANGGFEQPAARAPAGWTAEGKPLVDATGTQGYQSRTAIRADQNDWLWQRVPVQSGVIYVLRNLTRAAGTGQFARLQINWVNRRREVTAVDIQVVPAETAWHGHTLAAIAPADAVWADVYASVHDGSEAWLDDFSFTELRYRFPAGERH